MQHNLPHRCRFNQPDSNAGRRPAQPGQKNKDDSPIIGDFSASRRKTNLVHCRLYGQTASTTRRAIRHHGADFTLGAPQRLSSGGFEVIWVVLD